MKQFAVRDLRVLVGDAEAVAGVDFTIGPGERVGLVGESGAGKSLSALAIMGLLPEGLRASGQVLLDDRELLAMPESGVAAVRGRNISMIFQDSLAALNPSHRIGRQVAEAITLHGKHSRSFVRKRVVELLREVQLPDVDEKMRAYPHELSGGQRQRVMLAMALACEPDLVIADEPTTALDVTVQAQVLRTLDRLVREKDSSLLLITHDLTVIATLCERVIVMYGGKLVESGPTAEVLSAPRHPYTKGLIGAIPPAPGRGSAGRSDEPLSVIDGVVPPVGKFPSGCVFRDRCDRAESRCETMPDSAGGSHSYACWFPLPVPERPLPEVQAR